MIEADRDQSFEEGQMEGSWVCLLVFTRTAARQIQWRNVECLHQSYTIFLDQNEVLYWRVLPNNNVITVQHNGKLGLWNTHQYVDGIDRDVSEICDK